MKRVVIIGMGFGGIRAARVLAGKGLDVVLVDRNNYHLFQPLLYQVGTAGLEQESIAYPVRAMAREWRGTRFHLAEVAGVDFPAREVVTGNGRIPYDYLIIGAGSVTNYFGLESVERHAFDLKELVDGERLRNHILTAFERAVVEPDPAKRRALMTFVIVGGGPTGVEFAGALMELVRYVLAKDYPELSVQAARVVLVEAFDRLLAAMPQELQVYTLEKLRAMGVEVLFNARVVDAEPERVILHDGAIIPAHTLFWSAGVKAAPLAATLGVTPKPGGRIPVEPDLTLAGHPEVYVIGDMAHLEQDGAALPMVAPVAMQMGTYAGEAIVAREKGETPKPFRYRDRGSMATIGRSAAVACAFGMKFRGFSAWLVWLLLHLYYLIGFRNRIVVMLNWIWYYWFHERQVRLITERVEE
ncbi:FAD-dependent pyridine nucleotide-disulfide oxidoreductase [Geobacter metallireducens RCH3]|uniref:NADH:ubiquinone reductase (non-electrogenic) n=1 Tax=Geobacter metallireducens (strain ATCC 53774 / DSM 7210 / GS-15) TaxID=269799 RepID=Q39R68_GEOMG|nr:NAD(P)/FAD-dependent oxidoreductase [Geobacter metallireducens]ABB33256.1 FAD-dependent pyridine nucleotide-disulfide oxidoreductase family protein [Geobacter metallireducens GS-15]EHP85834.1 FAD-dependent pyridine nucleotide-disulfide oxidoreductase [Geobacter metallireducens RCH3]